MFTFNTRSVRTGFALVGALVLGSPTTATAQQPATEPVLTVDGLLSRLSARHIEDAPAMEEVAAMGVANALPVLTEAALDSGRIFAERGRALIMLSVFDEGIPVLLEVALDRRAHVYLRAAALQGLALSSCPEQPECTAQLREIEPTLLTDTRAALAVEDILNRVDMLPPAVVPSDGQTDPELNSP
jgi:hypothetical protein